MYSFDYQIFEAVLKRAYFGFAQNERPYSFEATQEIFKAFFDEYERQTGKPHPPVSVAQVREIIQKMPVLDKCGDLTFDERGALALYPILIQSYFKTRFTNCDYRISHFFSGRIRELRYYEHEYRG